MLTLGLLQVSSTKDTSKALIYIRCIDEFLTTRVRSLLLVGAQWLPSTNRQRAWPAQAAAGDVRTDVRAPPVRLAAAPAPELSKPFLMGRSMALDLAMPILVVDDNPSVLGVLVLLLQKIGFTAVDDAADGAAALAKMHQKKYGLVISDWQMQPMDGHNLLKQVRSTKALAEIPFIMVTVSLEAKKVISAKQAGLSGHASAESRGPPGAQ